MRSPEGEGVIVPRPLLHCAGGAFFRERAVDALRDSGFADLASVGDEKDVHFVAFVLGDQGFHDGVSLIGSCFLGDESESFRNAVDMSVDRECWHVQGK